MVILYDTAARVQELVDLRRKDVRLASPSVITLHGNGNKTRQVPIMEKTKNLLQKYLEENKEKAGLAQIELPLFCNQQHKQFSRWGISYIINKYVDMAKQNPNFLFQYTIDRAS